ncbi:MAG: protein kinase [Anaerolineales bacterium]
MSEIRAFLERHLEDIFAGDVEAYHQSCAEDLTIYEWYVTPHRIDGLPFHDFMLEESARDDTAAMALDPEPGEKVTGRTRFDLANYKEQVYGDTAVCSYTMLISQATDKGVKVLSYNESRVLARLDGAWKVVHVHKSPAWTAPFQSP